MNHFLCRMAVIFSACSVPWDGEVGEMRKNPRWKAEESVGRADGEQVGSSICLRPWLAIPSLFCSCRGESCFGIMGGNCFISFV